MIVVAALPDLPGELSSEGERESSLDELNASLDSVFPKWRQKDMDVFRHDDESVHRESSGISVLE